MSPEISPYTGLTRADWEATADRLLTSVRPYATAGHSLIHLPGPQSRSGRHSDGLEGFARTFLLAAFRLAGAAGSPGSASSASAGADAQDDDPLGLAEWYAEGLMPKEWPTLDDCPQARVEAASIAMALHETRPWIWDRLPATTQEQLVDWLGAATRVAYHANNWVWFQNITEAFLRSVGGPSDPANLERNLALHEGWYAGDGWYTDGGTRNFDYYNWWAMHFYPLWYCRMSGSAELLDRYRQRLRRFLSDAVHLVGANGAPVLQGRSATYRFGMLVPFWAGALFDATPLTPGLTRRLASGVLKYFTDRGAIDGDGLLPIGWHGAFPDIRQPYSGGGSPYWAGKAFAGLLLPADHSVWTAVEEPLPVEQGDTSRLIGPPGWLVSGTAADGIIRVASHGTNHNRCETSPHDRPFYDRHGYSSHTAPEMGETTWDSCIALIGDDGNPLPRLPIEPVAAGPGWLASSSPGLTTASVSRGPIEVRLAVCSQPRQLHFGGWALADPAVSGLHGAIIDLGGLPEAGVTHFDNTNPMSTPTAVPWLRSAGPAEPGSVYAAAVVLSGDPLAVAEARRISVAGCTVTWPDGQQVTVDLGR